MAGPLAEVHVVHGPSPALPQAVAGLSAEGVRLTRAADATGLPERGMLVVELEALPPALWDEIVRSRPTGRGLVLVGGAELRARLTTMFERRLLRHLLAHDAGVDPKQLQATISKLTSGNLFGTGCYLDSRVERRVLRIRRASEKATVMKECSRFAAAAGVTGRLATEFCTVAEELVTNAIYDAPVDARGASRFADCKRDVEVELEPTEAIEVELADDGARLAVCVTDPFGSLSCEQVQDSMARCLRKGADQIAYKPGGAGLGLYHSYERLSHLVFNIAERRMTQVIGVIDRRGTFRDWAARGKSFDVFSEGELT
jgi:hypothetical protein